MGALRSIQVASGFTYIGGQRFILGGTADAEQHLFVVADSSRMIQQLVWIQVESRLPQIPGVYDYSADSAVRFHGLPLAAGARTYSAPPQPSSDRASAFALIRSAGYRFSERATRLRLVYLPEQPARREVMIVYVVPAPAGEPDPPMADLLARAAAAFVLTH